MAAKTYDWQKWRQIYITGNDDVTFKSISEMDGAPKFNTIRQRAAEENWTGQRAQYQLQVQKQTFEHTAIAEAEVRARQIGIARELQDKALERLRSLDVSELSARDTLQYLRDATDIERKAMGMSEEHNVNVRGASWQLENLDKHQLIEFRNLLEKVVPQ